jgi:hypothetical protein
MGFDIFIVMDAGALYSHPSEDFGEEWWLNEPLYRLQSITHEVSHLAQIRNQSDD